MFCPAEIIISVGEVKAKLTFTDSDTYDIPEGIVNTAITEIDVSGAVAGGFSPYSFSKESGPEWLIVSADGKITGTRPAEAAAATDALIRVTDNAGFSDIIVIKVGAVTSAVAPAAPQNPVWAGTTAKWDAVDGAEQYRVILYANDSSALGGFSPIFNMPISETSKNFSEYMLPGMYYSFGVAAIKGEVQSGFSESSVKQMDGVIGTITGFTWNGNTVSWDAVENATGYDIWIMKDGKQHGGVVSVVDARFDLTEVINTGGDGSYYLMVKAYKLESGNYLATGTSASITVNEGTAGTKPVTVVSLNKASTTIVEGGTETLTATVSPEDATNKAITWSSSDASVASVADGVVTAHKVGTATITVKTVDGGKTATCEVTVTAKPAQTIIAADVTATYGDSGKKVTATTSGDGAISYAVKSGSEDYIDVAADGTLTIKKVGEAYVTVTAAETENYATATKDVKVTIDPKSITPEVTVNVPSEGYTYDGSAKIPGVTVKNGDIAQDYPQSSHDSERLFHICSGEVQA